MAKSGRASVRKHNRTNLRHKVFGPAEQARLERLSSKLQDIAAQPKPDRLEDVEMDTLKNLEPETAAKDTDVQAMEIDKDATPITTASAKSRSTRKVSRVQKKRRGKATSTITFPKARNGRSGSTARKSKK